MASTERQRNKLYSTVMHRISLDLPGDGRSGKEDGRGVGDDRLVPNHIPNGKIFNWNSVFVQCARACVCVCRLDGWGKHSMNVRIQRVRMPCAGKYFCPSCRGVVIRAYHLLGQLIKETHTHTHIVVCLRR